ncbi:probable helicase MAGATAMA 3 isoform X1 [Beta vulgaris subsp. vulgaris]|uniref:probable helicase MAGATAMA 3 isoform X1 n=2 Tax=Beta vulgaris subsp. vulgaris TaxID=3555 RepID=UPI0020371B5C|nr:probable helicase MAGATAMA 3 isoform X1 [Beta vulgaris subsp. vulgaris]
MAIEKNKVEEEACMIRFYKIVLSWDYFRILQHSKKSSRDIKKGSDSGLKEVKDTFKDIDDYLSTFEPLLFEEVKAQISQAKNEEEGTSVHEQKMCLVKECSDSEGFYFPVVLYRADEGESISQNELLLLSKEKFEKDKFPSTYAFALVEHRQYDSLRLRMFLQGEVKGIDIHHTEPCVRLVNMRSRLSEEKTFFYISKVCSLSTIFREFVAMRSIGSLNFRDVILRGADSTANTTTLAWEIPGKLMESIESNHNESQLEAIRAGLSRKSFVLIQGPPGTGKTQTILGLLNAILHSVPARMHVKDKMRDMKRGPELPMGEKCHHWRLASPWMTKVNPRDEIMPVDGDDGFFPTSGNELKPEVVNSSRKYRVRVLVCAPSNSALDEIVLRVLNTGVRDENNRAYNPKIVRIGLKAHHSVQAVSMDYLVEQKLAGLEGHLDRQKQGGAGSDRDSIRASILDEAVIVFSTLSFSGSTIFSKLNRGFDIVIIDEAAQAVEPATLVPLSTGCKQVFLVGDPVQLPATVISPVAEKLGYGMSLFKRFQRAGYPVLMLKTQYRMHPEIRNFPSREFYDDALEDGADVEEQTKRGWHDYRCFRPFCFFDVQDGTESQPAGNGSWVNVDEVEFALLMYQKLVAKYPELKSSSRVAIISPYRLQVKLFRQRFREIFGIDSEKVVDINTVDGFQGREKDVAIFSCVRASKDRGIGFVADFRRMNVGITRARSCILVVGSASTLKRDKHWSNLVEAAEKNNSLFKISKPYASFFSDESLKSMEVEVEPPDFDEEMLPYVSLYNDADNSVQAVDDYEDGGFGDAGGDD